MDLLKKIFGGAGKPSVTLPADLTAVVSRYLQQEPLHGSLALSHTRFVVLDISTTGLDSGKDRITSIAAVAIKGGVIDPADVLAMDLDAPDEARGFAQERQLACLLQFIGNSPVAAYPAPFVAAFLAQPMKALLGIDFAPVWINLATMLPELFRDQIATQVPVDEWLHLFEIEAEGRHDALVDAVAEAKLMQIAMVRLAQREVFILEQLLDLEKARQWLRA